MTPGTVKCLIYEISRDAKTGLWRIAGRGGRSFANLVPSRSTFEKLEAGPLLLVASAMNTARIVLQAMRIHLILGPGTGHRKRNVSTYQNNEYFSLRFLRIRLRNFVKALLDLCFQAAILCRTYCR